MVNRGIPAPRVERIPLPCRASSPPLTTLLMSLVAFIVIALPALPIPIAWLVMCAYPAYAASRRFRIVPRLLLVTYAAALLASSSLWILCATSPLPPEELPVPLPSVESSVDLAASLLLGSACLWKARSGGGERLLSFLTFYALVGTFRWGA